jgi:DNA polymerase-3 subunit alpha (Gram-positive type)
MDNAEIKRVELYAHTQMSAMSGLVSARDLITRAAKWGHKAIAITDTESVQAFPKAYRAGRELGVKIIYGAEVGVHYTDNLCYNVTILVRNQAGLKNLYKLISHSRITESVLKEHREGLLLGLTCEHGCPHERMELFDYFMIQPNGIDDIMCIGERFNKPVVASGEVHYLDPEDKEAWIVLSGIKYHRPHHFKTTEEMLEDFAFLGEDRAYEVVVTNTNLIADMIDDGIQPIPDGRFLPVIDGADDDIVSVCHSRAAEIYGENLPAPVAERLDKELVSIVRNGFSSLYMVARALVKKSEEAGYMVSTRGSVGASLVAYLLGISEFDPLEYGLPFEVFGGLDGERTPDMGLNFDSEYQAEAMKHLTEIFGEDKVFRAGSVRTINNRTAWLHVNDYFKENKLPRSRENLAKSIEGVKKFTSQFPGRQMIIPPDKDIFDFTPVELINDIPTAHFDYRDLQNTTYKLDILRHAVPTKLKRLTELTGVDINAITLDNKETLEIFINAETYGIPEFDTRFVRNLILKANPKSFTDLIQISGFFHSSGGWYDNADKLIISGEAILSEVIALRDDIMVYLIERGVNRKIAFEVMENVRKDKGLTDEHSLIIKSAGVPEWYIKSCERIEYLFSKAHAVAYTLNAFRLAWFKVHFPKEFYKVFFEMSDEVMLGLVMSYSISEIKNQIVEMEEAHVARGEMYELLQIRLEMLERG